MAAEEGGYVGAGRGREPCRSAPAGRVQGVVVGTEEGAGLVEHLSREVQHDKGGGGVVPTGPTEARHDEEV